MKELCVQCVEKPIAPKRSKFCSAFCMRKAKRLKYVEDCRIRAIESALPENVGKVYNQFMRRWEALQQLNSPSLNKILLELENKYPMVGI